MDRRAYIVVGFVLFCFAAVSVRLVDIMLLSHETLLSKARGQQLKKETIPVRRGLIYDRRGRELAINLEAESIFCNPAEIGEKDREELARVLSRELNEKPSLILAKLSKGKHFNWVERKVSRESTETIKNMHLRGIYLSPDAKRFYPKGNLASHIIGHVNIDGAGLEGVERQYDRYLNAKAEVTYVERDAKGNELSEGTRKEIRGNNVVLTIDEGLQYILEKKLDDAVEHWKADSATAIMMDPYTGEILAMASRPTYDANEPGSVKAAQRRNRGITDCYEPGSTFKIIVGTAALEERVVKPDMKFDCSAGNVEVGGRKIKDAHRHGVLTFKEVIQKSSNVGSIKIGLLLGKEKVYEYIKKYGFGEKTGIDLMGEVSGWVRTPEKWSGMSIGAISIGQEIAVTPLQVLRAYSVIANGGFLVKPHVVAEVFSPDGKLLYEAAPETVRVISEKNANIFKDILKTVTIEGGTATQAAVNGNEVAGKTGTAQKMDPVTKRYSRDRFISSFVGFVPAGDPRIAMIIVINEPRGQIYGGVVAAPVFRDIANEALSYLRIPRDDSQEKGLHLVSSK